MREHKNFWDRNADLYDCFMRKDRAVYEKMYELIRPVVKDKTVLELATGTGLIAKHIVKVAARIEATDASPCLLYTSDLDSFFNSPVRAEFANKVTAIKLTGLQLSNTELDVYKRQY